MIEFTMRELDVIRTSIARLKCDLLEDEYKVAYRGPKWRRDAIEDCKSVFDKIYQHQEITGRTQND
jgi:hypothetical protein